jgi:hypothetical protein
MQVGNVLVVRTKDDLAAVATQLEKRLCCVRRAEEQRSCCHQD